MTAKARTRTVILGWGLLTLASLGLMELTCRIALPLLGLPATYDRPQRSEFEPWGAWGVPGTQNRFTASCFDVAYSFNSQGARDRERSKQGEARSVMIGDSFVEGYGVEASQRISDQLEARMGREVLNFSASANFGPLQYLILYRDLASKFEHDTLIAGLLPDNDFTDNDPKQWESPKQKAHWLRHRPYWTLGPDGALGVQYGVFGQSVPRKDFDLKPVAPAASEWKRIGAQLSYAGRSLKRHSSLAWLIAILAERAGAQGVPQTAKPPASEYFSTNQREIAATELIYGELAKAAEGKRKVLIVFPRPHDIAAQKANGAQASAEVLGLLKALAAQGWEVIDLSQSPQIRDFPSLVLACDDHWNAAAQALAADIIAEKLR